jgi:gluconate 2-dehydrogenase alpha chain
MDDFNGDNFDHTGLGFIRGAIANVAMGEATPIQRSSLLPPGTKGWGADYKRFIHESSLDIASFSTQLEVLAYEGNFLDLDPTKKDDIGMPVVRVTFNLGENEKKANQWMNPKMEAVLKEMGASRTWSYPDPANIPINSHAYGGTRMGDDPGTSVVNKYGLSHEAPNLMVLGGSNWVSTTGYNPTITIEAHAWYATSYLAQNLGKIAV